MKKILFIHVGKSGGSSIKNIIKGMNVCHLNKPTSKQLDSADLIIINIRDPIKRFVSAFNYAYNIINYDISNLNKNSNLTKLIAPFHIKNKIIRGYAYNKEYNDLINYFRTPNNLAESLTDINEKNKASELMSNHTEHIFKSLGYYTDNGQIIEKYHNKIFVISVENFNEDIKNLYRKIYNKNIDTANIKIMRKTINHNTDLSELAIKNIYNFYKDKDYKTIDILHKFNLIGEKLHKTYTQNIF